MPYQVTVDWAPAYELAVSLHAFMSEQTHRLQEQGDRWAEKVKEQLHPATARTLAEAGEPPCLRTLGLLIHQVQGVRSAPAFLKWFATVSPGELYERLSPHAPPDGVSLWANLGAVREQYMAWLYPWYTEYFSHLDPGILQWLEARAAALGRLALQVSGPDVVEHATGGYDLAPRAGIRRVVLVPQYHKRPLTQYFAGQDFEAFLHPVEDLPVPAGVPSPGLLRAVRAVADESRLRMLHLLARGPLTFTQVVDGSRLTKGTVHKHLSALKGAGLLRTHFRDGAVVAYSLRPGAFSRLSGMLEGFAER